MTSNATSPTSVKKSTPAEKKYKCSYCSRAFSRSEHRSRHERSHTKERPFRCQKCKSTFVRRDLLLRHDRTVHAKDGGIPLQSEATKRKAAKQLTGQSPAKKQALAQADDDDSEQTDDVDDDLGEVETAAMLMTGLHQRAAAEMESQAYAYGANEGLGLDGPSLLDSSVRMPLHDDSWPDQMGLNDSHLSDLSWTVNNPSPSTTNPLDAVLSAASYLGAQMPPKLDMSFPSFSHATVPRTFETSQSPITPQSTTASYPRIPQLAGVDDRTELMWKIEESDSERTLEQTFELPELDVLNSYLSAYFRQFHHHWPLLHPATFVPANTSASLLLAVLSIGAMYAGNPEQAMILHVASKVLLCEFLSTKENFSSRKAPLWIMQTTLLNMMYSSWSGESKGLEWACSVKSTLANMVSGSRYMLKFRSEARGQTTMEKAEWLEDESCRRTYFAVYIFFGLLTMTFNHAPVIAFDELEQLELPCAESIWNTDDLDDDTWRARVIDTPPMKFREAYDRLFQGQLAHYSAFATRIMINALFIQVWTNKRTPGFLQDMVTDYKVRVALDIWEKSLDLCENESVAIPVSSPGKGHPLIFNALAMYRNTIARLEVDLKSVQEALRYHEPYEIAAAMSSTRNEIHRSTQMLKVIQHAYDCLSTVATQGVRWMNRKAAVNWSIEQPLCDFDLMIILTMWIYRLENDIEDDTPEELAMHQKIIKLFDSDMIANFNGRVSSLIARLWGSILDNQSTSDKTTVWGFTKTMGQSFQIYSQSLIGYQDGEPDYDDLSSNSSPILAPNETHHHPIAAF